jgi:hypothetical protein
MCPIPQNPNIPAIMAIKKAKPLFLKGMEATVNLYKQQRKAVNKLTSSRFFKLIFIL